MLDYQGKRKEETKEKKKAELMRKCKSDQSERGEWIQKILCDFLSNLFTSWPFMTPYHLNNLSIKSIVTIPKINGAKCIQNDFEIPSFGA